MDLLNLGTRSRKTGIEPRQNLTKDKYNMEDIDEFFSDDEAPPRYNLEARRINFTDEEAGSFNLSPIQSHRKILGRKSPLGSPLPDKDNYEQEQTYEQNYDQNYEQNYDDDEFEEEYVPSQGSQLFYSQNTPSTVTPVSASPRKSPNVQKRIGNSQKRLGTSQTRLTNATGGSGVKSLKSLKSLKSPITNRGGNLGSSIINSGGSLRSSQKGGILRSPQKGASLRSPQKGASLRSPQNGASPIITKASSFTKNMALGKSKKLTRVSNLNNRESDRRISESEQTELTGYTVQASPLPSPPPDGLRRSRRTKIAPLAFWRNERIVYTRAFENVDPDTSLVANIKNVPLQEIKEVVHYPEVVEDFVKRKRISRKQKREKEKDEYDYESDPEIPGSEWFQDGEKILDVVIGDVEKAQLIAYSPEGAEYEIPKSVTGLDNFKVAPLFDRNTADISAAGLIEFPFEGIKMLHDSGKILYNFHVVKGLIEVELNGEKFVVTRGCSFQVPSENMYGFKNVGNSLARLYFVQTRVVVVEEEERSEEW